jgi:hypothetical protein
MDPIKKGELTEARGFKALQELKDIHPDLILSVRQSPPAVDARGIDNLTRVTLPVGTGKDAMTVPIEWKSSRWGVEKWKVTHSDLHKARVLIFYIPDDMTPRELRNLIYRALEKVRKNSKGGRLYHSMFQRLFARKPSKNLTRNIELIKGRRAKK